MSRMLTGLEVRDLLAEAERRSAEWRARVDADRARVMKLPTVGGREQLPRSPQHLTAILRAAKWNRENIERHRAHDREYMRKPEVRARAQARRKKARLEQQRARVYSCLHCEVKWCLTPLSRGKAGKWCGHRCRQAYRYAHDAVFRETAKTHSRSVHAAKRAA